MLKKLLGLLICISIVSFYSVANAHDRFTWFGLRRGNTEILIQSPAHHPDCGPHDCGKHKHKHGCHKKGPKHHHKCCK